MWNVLFMETELNLTTLILKEMKYDLQHTEQVSIAVIL